MYEILWTHTALKQIKNIVPPIAKRIAKAIEQLKNDPFRKVRKMRGYPYYRIKIGDYRIILKITENRIYIMDVGHRKNIYKNIKSSKVSSTY